MSDGGAARGARRLAHSDDQQRLLVKVARMYHERGLRQQEIATTLSISQPRVSRLLKRAVETGVVRTIVTVPIGVHADLEEQLEQQLGLAEVVLADFDDADPERAVATAAATYLETTLVGGERVGISSWSASLLAAVDAMRPAAGSVVDSVVQLVGGVGDPRVQVDANRLITRFARVTGATPVFLPAPGLLGSGGTRASLMSDSSIAQVTQRWSSLSTALVGIGTLEPSPMLRRSGNGIGSDEEDTLRAAGAVGDVCLRFFDAQGRLVASDLDDRVIGISPEAMRRIPRRVAVAGGERKLSAIRAAALGRWVNVLITDAGTARLLLAG